MPSSELSDALNPYYAQPRSRSTHVSASQPVQQSAPQQAVSEPPAPFSPPISHSPARSSNPQGGGIHAVQELFRFVASMKEAQEIDQKRRIAWEQEQEAKYMLRQAEMEGRMLEMQQEITALKARVAFGGPASSSAAASSVNIQSNPSQLERGTVVSSQQPTPSTSPTLSELSSPPVVSNVEGTRLMSPVLCRTRFIHTPGSSSFMGQTTVGTESEQGSDTDDTAAQYRVRRKNHHDTRCLTIQHAMRNHILRVMMLDSDKELPDSHAEGTPLGPEEAVRFVWDKTPRQSVHNGRMKERVLKDLKANRKLYRHVADKEFGKKTLDSVFDQAFVTLRQKFKAQRDDGVARLHKQREEVKAQRARRASRRKVKLGNRSDARNKMAVFEHVTFDGALQLECMSSEESEVEEEGETRSTVLRIRGIPWRSVRLQRFFDALDEGDRMEQRARRGVGRMERVAGVVKEGVAPPGGVSRWMVSKRWMGLHGGCVEVVEGCVGLPDVLGEESE